MTTRVLLPVCAVCGAQGSMDLADEDAALLAAPDRPLIQDIFPDMPIDQREFLITGTHPECWDSIFGEDEE